MFAVDVRNHGDSPHLPDMTYHDMTHDVVELMKEREIAEADILGHSMGGKIAMYMALTQVSLVNSAGYIM